MEGKFSKTRRVLVTAIAGFLILLHGVGLSDTYMRAPFMGHSAYTNVQSLLSLLIIASLVLAVLAKPIGLIGIWVSITALILTQYWAHFGFYDADFTDGRSAFSYLRGFVIPTAITALFLLPLKAKS